MLHKEPLKIKDLLQMSVVKLPWILYVIVEVMEPIALDLLHPKSLDTINSQHFTVLKFSTGWVVLLTPLSLTPWTGSKNNTLPSILIPQELLVCHLEVVTMQL